MRAALSILGIVCAALAVLMAVLLSGPFMPFVVLAVLVVTGVLAILARGAHSLPVGIVLIVGGLLALLYYNPIGGDRGTYLPDLPQFFSEPLLVTLLLVGAAGVLWVNRAAWGADWVGYGGLAACALGIVVALLADPASFGGMGGLNWVVAVLAVAAAVACALLLREPLPEPAAPATTGTTARHR
ncbi:MAG: hypothetical protein QOD77_1701 [Thermoplasmata archaeon]|jgi:hypothetical protein|nr:hypothetical protein [Thermoplasmata archaeon]